MYTLIKKGTKNGNAVKELKVLLNQRMGSTLDVTNPDFGDSTEAVVKQFQLKKGLLVDGVVGDMTWAALYESGIGSNDMKTGKKGLDMINHFETGDNLKKYLTAYQDSVGVWTIGIGSTYYEDGTRVKKGDKITEERAKQLFANTLIIYEKEVKKHINVALNQNQFDALVSFTYNLGGTNLGKSTLAKKINDNPCDPSIRDEFIKWNRAGNKVLSGLTRRRVAEANLYFDKQI